MIIQRELFKKLLNEQSKQPVSILIGARQVGKSTLLHEIKKKINRPSRYLNLENPLHLKIFENGYNSFIREVKEDLIFIDEFHYLKNITSIFKAVYDLNPDKKIYASGSSSLEIHKHLKESLAGRKIQTWISSFSFSEWISQFDITLPNLHEYITVEEKDKLDGYLKKYLIYGSMPGLTGMDDDMEIREYLLNLYRTYISKDIKTFLKEESILSYNKLIEYIVINNTQLLNMNTLSKVAGISSRQVTRQIEVMTGTYILHLLKPLCNNKLKEITKTPKIYFYDQGIANIILNDFRPLEKRIDKGAVIENFVCWELMKSIDVRFNVKFWRTADKNEVDFILEKDREYLPVEVKNKWDLNRVPPGLKAFFRYYPEVKKGVVLCDCQDHSIQYNDKKIFFYPWYKAAFLKDFLL